MITCPLSSAKACIDRTRQSVSQSVSCWTSAAVQHHRRLRVRIRATYSTLTAAAADFIVVVGDVRYCWRTSHGVM